MPARGLGDRLIHSAKSIGIRYYSITPGTLPSSGPAELLQTSDFVRRAHATHIGITQKVRYFGNPWTFEKGSRAENGVLKHAIS